jgi:RNA binding exosome subunit
VEINLLKTRLESEENTAKFLRDQNKSLTEENTELKKIIRQLRERVGEKE